MPTPRRHLPSCSLGLVVLPLLGLAACGGRTAPAPTQAAETPAASSSARDAAIVPSAGEPLAASATPAATAGEPLAANDSATPAAAASTDATAPATAGTDATAPATASTDATAPATAGTDATAPGGDRMKVKGKGKKVKVQRRFPDSAPLFLIRLIDPFSF